MVTPVADKASRTYHVGGAIKAIKGKRVGGYLVIWGNPDDKDSYGEYFTPATNFELDWYQTRPVLYHHTLNDAIQTQPIGVIDTLRMDDRGLYAEAELSPDVPAKVLRGLEAGYLYWSSGSLPHAVDVDTDGRITRWPIVEGSLTPTPAETSGRTEVALIAKALKTALEHLNEETKGLDDGQDKAPRSNGDSKDAITPDNPAPIESLPKSRGVKTMDAKLIAAMEAAGTSPEQILSVLKELGTGDPEEAEAVMMDGDEVDAVAMDVEQEEPARADDMYEEAARGKSKPASTNVSADDIKKLLQDEFNKLRGKSKAGHVTGNGNGSPVNRPERLPDITVKSKYADLSAADMDYLRFLRVKTGKGSLPPAFYRELVDKAQKAYKSGDLRLDEKQATRLMAIKANELNSTAAADDGGDWDPTLWSQDLWERTRIDNNVASSFRIVNMPSSSYELPVESTDPVVYAVGETTDEQDLRLDDSTYGTFTKSKVVADKVTLNSAKLGLQVHFSAELEEDSIIQFIPQLRAQALRAMQDAIDNVILNADATTGTTNINYADANTSAVPKSKWLYGGGDGLRHLTLVDGSNLAINMQNVAPTLQKIRQARFALLGAYAVKPSELVYFTDVETWGKLLNIDELLSYSNNGRGSTVNDGIVPMIDGSPVYPSEELSLTNASGYVSSNTANNTRGQIIVAHRPSWTVGYRRNVVSDLSYLPYYDSYVLTMTTRMALARRDATCAAILYNINVS